MSAVFLCDAAVFCMYLYFFSLFPQVCCLSHICLHTWERRQTYNQETKKDSRFTWEMYFTLTHRGSWTHVGAISILQRSLTLTPRTLVWIYDWWWKTIRYQSYIHDWPSGSRIFGDQKLLPRGFESLCFSMQNTSTDIPKTCMSAVFHFFLWLAKRLVCWIDS